jgi:uncharacterized repeat protein (TIGR01451 family)
MIRIDARILARHLPATAIIVLASFAGGRGSPAAADPAQTLSVTMTAELEQVQAGNGRVTVRLLPADHVVPGDSLIFTLQVRNTGSAAVPMPQFSAPIPKHTSYVADSAVAPAAEISYSVDAGQSFDEPQNLRVPGADGAPRPATAADYTHIRWTLRHSLKPNSVVYARFRARLN